MAATRLAVDEVKGGGGFYKFSNGIPLLCKKIDG